jgi:alpha-L-rhamnosidase
MRYQGRCVLLPALVAVVATVVAAEGPVTVTNLRCEYATNPLGLDTAQPRLSWVINSDQRGQKQTAYQILVSSSVENLAASRPDLWDTGKVASDQSTQVPYKGSTLSARQRCYWKVRVWDKDGGLSVYSDTALWEMGLLSQKDWRAEWIGYTGGWPGRALYFRSDIAVRKAVKRARAYIAGLGYYELRLNGATVGDHVLDPGFTDYSKRVLYATYDIGALLKPGSNAIGVIVGHGWYGTPKLLMQLEVTYIDDSAEMIYTNHTGSMPRGGSWRVTSGPVLDNSVYDGEVYDARLEKAGWDLPGNGARNARNPSERTEGWQSAVLVPPPGGQLVSQTVNPIKIVDTIRPKGLTDPKPGVFVYDIGRNMAGWAELHVTGEPGRRITLKFSELLAKDGTADQENLRKAAATDVYILKGGGEENWEPRFTYHGFRYVQVEGFPTKPTLDNLTAKVVRSSVEPNGVVETSNDLINRIQQMVRWTEASNLHSIPTDCPQRDERMGWMNDLTVRVEEVVYNFNMSRFFPKFLRDIRDTQTENGAIADTVPFRGGSRPADPVSASFLLLSWFLYQHYGDTQAMAEHLDGFKAWTDFLASKSEGNIVTYGYYGDWSPPAAFAVPGSSGTGAVSRDTPREFMSTGYLYYCSRLVARMAGILGREDDKAKYEKLAGQVAKAFNQKYWNETVGGYGSNNQASNSFALFLGLVPEKQVPRVVENLVKDVREHDGHLTTGNLCTKYLLDVLAENGRADVVYEIAKQQTYPSWGFMLANGATTLWERWEQLTGSGMNSHNHPMMGSVSSWFYKYLAGINTDPQGPGFKRIVIRPYPVGDLNWVRSEYTSMYGLIRSSWRKEDGTFRLNVTVPINTTASVYVPAIDATHVQEGGKPAANAPGVKWLRNEHGAVVFEVGSGDYEFAVRR